MRKPQNSTSKQKQESLQGGILLVPRILLQACYNYTMNLRQLFQEKAEQLQLQEKGYIDKTVYQMSLVPKKNREELTRKIHVFLKCNPRKAQILFNEIAGVVNDYQLLALHDFND